MTRRYITLAGSLSPSFRKRSQRLGRARYFVDTLIAVVRQEPVFLRNTGQPEDSFFVLDRPVNPFAVQLDPLSRSSLSSISLRSRSLETGIATVTPMPVAGQDRYGVPQREPRCVTS